MRPIFYILGDCNGPAFEMMAPCMPPGGYGKFASHRNSEVAWICIKAFGNNNFGSLPFLKVDPSYGGPVFIHPAFDMGPVPENGDLGKSVIVTSCPSGGGKASV